MKKTILRLLICFCAIQCVAFAHDNIQYTQYQMTQEMMQRERLTASLSAIAEKSSKDPYNKKLVEINKIAKDTLSGRIRSGFGFETLDMAGSLKRILALCDNYAADPLFSDLGDTAYQALRSSGIPTTRTKYLRKYK